MEKIDEYERAWMDCMKAIFVYTACSCSVRACSIWQISPMVACVVSSSVSPVNTRTVVVRSRSLSARQSGTSFDSGTFSGSQKLATRRFHTSRSLSSVMRFQLMGRTREP